MMNEEEEMYLAKIKELDANLYLLRRAVQLFNADFRSHLSNISAMGYLLQHEYDEEFPRLIVSEVEKIEKSFKRISKSLFADKA